MTPTFAIAPGFHLPGALADRLSVAEGDGWRAPSESEIAALAAADTGVARCALFAAPIHLRRRFWAMLEEQQETGDADFVGFAGDLAAFLAFKELPPPGAGVVDLVIQDVGGSVDLAGLWGLANFGEAPVLIAWPGLRLKLEPGEGCVLPAGALPAVVAPADEPNVLVAIRADAPPAA